MTWTIERVEAWQAHCNGVPFGDVKRTKRLAKEYKERLERRYSEREVELLTSVDGQEPDVYTATWPVGNGVTRTEKVAADSLRNAKVLLREQLGRKRLPNGIKWT